MMDNWIDFAGYKIRISEIESISEVFPETDQTSYYYNYYVIRIITKSRNRYAEHIKETNEAKEILKTLIEKVCE